MVRITVPVSQNERLLGEALAWHDRIESEVGTRTGVRDELERWLSSDPAHQEAYDRVMRLWRASDEVAELPEILQMRQEAMAIGDSRPRDRSSFIGRLGQELAFFSQLGRVFQDGVQLPKLAKTMSVSAIAASYVLMAAVLLWWVVPIDGPQIANTTSDQLMPRIYQTATGERSTVALSDGTILTLNTDSVAAVDMSTVERRVILQKGQALFRVAKDASRPFVVTVDDVEVVAIGTEFDVLYESDEVKVTLVEGRVGVVENANSEEEPDPSKMTYLEPNEQYYRDEENHASIMTVDVSRIMSWREGRLIFSDDPLPIAVAEMNRYSDRKLVLDDIDVEEYSVTGVFRTGNVDSFVAAIESAYPLSAMQMPDGTIIIGDRGQSTLH